ncbi:MAG: adenosylmethionine decarboxylase, partial [Planctomycetota bacterium]
AGCKSIPVEPGVLQEQMEFAARSCGATVICSTFHRFEIPTADGQHGLSGVVIIGESHLAVHTWPEHLAVCVDLFTCSPTMDAEPGIEYLKSQFSAEHVLIRHANRGQELGSAPSLLETPR